MRECKVTLVFFLGVPYTLSTARQEETCQQFVLSPKKSCKQNRDEDQLLVQKQPGIQRPPDTAPADALEMQVTSRFWNTKFLLHI